MFVPKNYILGNEIANHLNMNISNISMEINILEKKGNFSDNISLGNCNFLNRDSIYFSKYIRDAFRLEYTDMSNKLPAPYVRTEFGINISKAKDYKFIEDIIKIQDKEFVVFTKDFVETLKDKITYVLNLQELLTCMENDEIEGYYRLGENKYLTYYSINVGLSLNVFQSSY